MTERKPYFINDCCYGDDFARWMIAELKSQGIQAADEPGQEDFGWYLSFELASNPYTFCVSFRPDDTAKGATWIGFIERQVSPLGALFRKHKRDIALEACQLIDQVLSKSPQIREIRWYNERDSF